MEQTRRLVLALAGIALCGCMICQPPIPPGPSPLDWQPSGGALWSSSTLQETVAPEIQSAGQGGNHLLVTFNIGAEGLTSTNEVRFAAFVRAGSTQVGSANRKVTLDSSTTTLTLNVQICPGNSPVVNQPLAYEVWAAREGDHQLLSQKIGTVTPTCAGGGSSCGACQ